MNMALHTHTPRLLVIDPRGLALRSVEFCRSKQDQPADERVTCQAYDAAGRLVSQRDPRLALPNLSTTYSLSNQALLTESVDAGWRLGLLNEAGLPVEGWDSRGSRRQVEYDAVLRPLAITEDGLVTERLDYGGPDGFEHNQCNQLIRHDDTAGTRHLPDYGLLGAALIEARHFLHALETPDWPLAEAERDALLESDSLETQWAFNTLGEQIRQTDAMGNAQSLKQTVAGQLKAVDLKSSSTTQTLVSDIQYNAFNQVEQETAGNGVISRSLYDPQDGRLMEIRAGDPALQHLIYAYDPVGNILRIEDAAQPVRFFANQRVEAINHCRYDTLYQLIEATGREVNTGASHGPALPGLQPLPPDPNQISNYTQNYDYDSAGNLLQMRHVGAQNFTRTMRVAEDSNRSLPEGETDADFDTGFDPNGNQLQLVRGQTMEWDVRNQLQQITTVTRATEASDNERYIYDGQGQRCRKINSTLASSRTLNNEVRYLPGLEIRTTADGEVLHVITARNSRILHWQAGLPSGIANDQIRYSLSDHLGSNTLELDQQGNLISQESYYPFGGTSWWAARSAVEAKYTTIRYSGKERDASGLYYYGFRYYAPWLQRWINPDPSGDVDGLNLFCFVENNPINRIDPDGQKNEMARERWRLAVDEIKERKNTSDISVKTFAPGIIAVSIEGKNELFSRMGINFARPFKGKRQLSYLSLESDYKSKISGGDYRFPLKSAPGFKIYEEAGAPTSNYIAFINGGFYNNRGEASPSAPTHAAIGKIFMGGKEKASVDIPKGYEQYYVPLTMSDGSTIHTGPLLTSGGKLEFTEEHLKDKKFQYSPETAAPGQLGHAGTPNQRSGISMPVVFDKESRIRIAVGLGGGRTQSSRAYTMPEWANVMLKLDSMNATSGWSVNLDGGDSSVLGVVSRNGTILMDQAALANHKRRIPNFITFYK